MTTLAPGDQYECPKCERVGYYKPPYNTEDECMSCRWEREHPHKKSHTQSCGWCGRKLFQVIVDKRNVWTHEALEEGETCRLMENL